MKSEQSNLLNVFVYGTLKPGEVNYQRYCAGKVSGVQRAIAFGHLYALPLGYPAMTVGDSLVRGFVLSFSSVDILDELDWLEGYDASQPDINNEYTRQWIQTYNLDFKPLTLAWVYLMTSAQVETFGGSLLPDGWWSGCGLMLDDF